MDPRARVDGERGHHVGGVHGDSGRLSPDHRLPIIVGTALLVAGYLTAFAIVSAFHSAPACSFSCTATSIRCGTCCFRQGFSWRRWFDPLQIIPERYQLGCTSAAHSRHPVHTAVLVAGQLPPTLAHMTLAAVVLAVLIGVSTRSGTSPHVPRSILSRGDRRGRLSLEGASGSRPFVGRRFASTSTSSVRGRTTSFTCSRTLASK